MRYCTNCGKPLEDNQVCDCKKDEESIKEQIHHTYVSKPVNNSGKTWMCVVSAIIYPVIAFIISFFVSTGLPMLFVSLVLNIGTALCFYFGGFYLIVIPLPVITFFKWGCLKPELSLKVRIPLGILSFILPVLSIVLCAI